MASLVKDGFTTPAAWRPGGRPLRVRVRISMPAFYGVGVRVEASREAIEFVRARGGRLWVWAARPRVCCLGTPPYMHAETLEPAGLAGFSPVPASGIEVFFRAPVGRSPEVLEIGLRGRRRPRVEAYWDGLRVAL
jgi:hypothetical protein